jgi:D-sedoheptulose 7-phosphate isomerase
MQPDLAEQVVRTRLTESAQLKDAIAKDASFHALIATVGKCLIEALGKGRRVYFLGNGGSAADAQHLAAELTGRYLRERSALPAMALNANSSAVTAIGNDYGYEYVFSRQIEAFGASGDVVVGITTSGNSENVIQAMRVAHEKKMITVGLTGKTGGRLRECVDHCICIPSNSTPRIQEAHIAVGHVLCELVEEGLFGD